MSKGNTKLFIDTLGCPKNFNDSECAAGIWEKSGSEITDDPGSADAILINTCAFIGDAKKESIDRIFEYVRFADEIEEEGKTRPLICVSGCLSQRYSEELADEMPEVDVFLGVNEYEELPEIIDRALIRRMNRNEAGSKEFQRVNVGCNGEAFEEFTARRFEDEPYTATLRIAEGCNNRCAYCVIPSIRGNYRSRKMENILAEAEDLAEKGCKELMLIAQDVTEYGRDIYGRLALPELLKDLCRIKGIRWIRLMYCYEDKITDELIDVMAREEKICNYIDIPLQHVSDNVLGRMGRRSTNSSIRDTVGRLRKAIPDIHIRTTFITGFPGESEEDFLELSRFVDEIKFERVGVFPYSREEGTPAAQMPDQIDEEVKISRADEIMRHQIDISHRINQGKVGSTMEVIVDEMDETGAYLGRTRYDAPEIDNSVVFSSEVALKAGDIVDVRITDAFDYDLVGELV